MGKRGDRHLEQLYDLTERISEAEITPVLVGNCRIQGPVDEPDQERLRRTNSGSAAGGKKYTFPSENLHTRTGSGTCNVCSAPCSSCMHLNRTLSAMESRIDCGFSGSTCGIKEADTCSSIGVDRKPTYKSRKFDVSQHAASETSNLLRVSPSHESYSENAESKATHQPSVTCKASEDVDIPLIVPSVKTIVHKVCETKMHVPADIFCSSNSHTASDLHHRPFSGREEVHELECNEDNTSCVSGVRGSSISPDGHSLNEKDAHYFYPSSSSLLADGIKYEVQNKATDCCNCTDNKKSQCHNVWKTGSKVSLDKNAGSADPALSDKSDLADFSLPNFNPSTKVESPYCQTPSSSGQDDVIKDSEAAVKIDEPCLETENDTDDGISFNELMISSKISKESEVLRPLMPNMPEAQEQPQSVMVDGNFECETELYDVKVCDICGDSGREDLLAICTRCTDGAEHIYCMREMLCKVPEGDYWLCEECQLKEETKKKEELSFKQENLKDIKHKDTEKKVEQENLKDIKHKDTEKKVVQSEAVRGISKKVVQSEAVLGTSKECKVKGDTQTKTESKSQTVSGSSKELSQKESSPNPLRASNSQLPSKTDTKVIDTTLRGAHKGLESRQPSFKRRADSQDVISTGKQTWETCAEIGSPRKKIALSRESSFKDTGKARIANMLPACGGLASNGSKALSRSKSLLASSISNIQGSHRPHIGLLPKSASFNNFHAKTKLREPTINVPIKTKLSSESASMDTRKEALVRPLSKSISFKSGGFGRSRTESASKTQFLNQTRVESPRGMKQVKQSKVIEKNNSSIPNRSLGQSLTRPRANVSVPKLDLKISKNDAKLKSTSKSNIICKNKGSEVSSSLGEGEAKKHLTYSSKKFGSASFSLECSPDDQRARQPSKKGACGSFGAINKVSSNAEEVPQCVTPRGDKTKNQIFSSSRKVVSNGNQVLRCLKCNEKGHAAQFCSKLKLSAIKPSTERNSRDDNKKDSKCRDTVVANITKSRIQKSNQPDELEGLPVSGADLSSDATADRQEALRSSEDDPIKAAEAADFGEQAMQAVEVSSTPLLGDLSANVAVSDGLDVKHDMLRLADHASIFSRPFRTAFPKLDFIWQGIIEVVTTSREPELFDGIQVHLSSCASPKVHDVVVKFSSTVQLEEVSCVSTWPRQFKGSSPKEENIALFLFAKDDESYERSYSKLLDKMLKNDLALRGNIDGIKLLIYHSNKLPVSSQRWNKLFYLWGVFKRSPDCSKSLPSSPKKSTEPIIKAVSLVQDLPSSLSSFVPPPQKSVFVESSENESPTCPKSVESKALKSSTCMDDSRASSKFNVNVSMLQDSPPFHDSSDHSVADSVLPAGHISSSSVCHPLGNINHAPNALVTCPAPQFQTSIVQSAPEVKSDDTYQRNIGLDSGGNPVLDLSAHVNTNNEELVLIRAPPPISSDCRQEKDTSLRSEAVLYTGPRGNQMDSPNRKRPPSCSTETGSQASCETSRSTVDTVPWTDRTNRSPLNDERKKMRYGLRDETLELHPLIASFSNEQHRKFVDSSSGEARTLGSGRSFLLEEPRPDKVINVISSDDEGTPESNTLDLKLAPPGMKTLPKLETLPFLFQSPDRKKSVLSAADDEENVSASLALCLAPAASVAPEPISKSERLTPNTPRTDRSLLLFGCRLTDP